MFRNIFSDPNYFSEIEHLIRLIENAIKKEKNIRFDEEGYFDFASSGAINSFRVYLPEEPRKKLFEFLGINGLRIEKVLTCEQWIPAFKYMLFIEAVVYPKVEKIEPRDF